ncbi:MAG TPA: M28 family peptidase [Bryobacteraceae bacterium]|nr:M28 family peptidase [Bryobacteraceae bacterium]
MNGFFRTLFSAFLSIAFLFGQTQAPHPVDLIRTADLKADLFFLASDDLAGRNAGSLGDHVATDYIAAEFMRLALKPVGDNGTYFQNMDFVYGNLDPEHTTLTGKIAGADHTFAFNKDFRWVRSSIRDSTGCGSIVFAGYGIDAPEYGYNDLAGLELKGKVALVLPREPQANDANSKFMGTWDTYHAFNWEKIELLRKKGVAGVLIVQGVGPSHAVKPVPPSSPRAIGGPNIALAGDMWNVPVFTIQADIANQFLAPSGKTIEVLQQEIDRTTQAHSFDVPQSSACLSKAFTNIETHQGRNVVGLLEGSDPHLKAQTIILTAHHDHMGEMNGHIYHGADDNGSGTTAVMRIAQAFVEGQVRPKRSILFMVYDGEERIFLGSYYYVAHPLVPLSETVANFNLDMIGRDENEPNWPVPPDRNVNMVNVLGTRYNPELSRIIADANRTQGLILDHKMDTVDPDSLWSRSDHYWMATLHIPQVEFQTGLHPDYHTDNDTWQRINYDKLTRITKLIFLSIDDLANSARKIAFLPAGAPPPSSSAEPNSH